MRRTPRSLALITLASYLVVPSETMASRDEDPESPAKKLSLTEPFARIRANDLARNLVDSDSLVDSLEAMEQRSLESARLGTAPWSAYYWPTMLGTLGFRYADENFTSDWSRNHRYVLAHPAREIVQGGSRAELSRLSPAEKYDLVMGDESFTLTNAMWKEGERLFRQHGEVAWWAGLCDGWASAALMMPRPRRTVSVQTQHGSTVDFFPSDIQALASALWARSNKHIRHIGGRCNIALPQTDSESGRVVEQDCADTNPGTWHLVVVNQIGIVKRGFILDATSNDAIWNYPAFQYEYSYFNPETRKSATTLAAATVPIGTFDRDPYRAFRSPETRYVVGINMEFTYVSTIDPTTSRTASLGDDIRETIRYIYDLELDAEHRIIGGEWYTNHHPDFLWVPEKNSKAETAVERWARESWSGKGPIPKSWQVAAPSASRHGQPLAKLVYALFELAQ